jgi:hypothetical protein
LFPATYSALVGGPSLLAITQAMFKEWRLTPAFQWIADGYSWLTAQLASCLREQLPSNNSRSIAGKDRIRFQFDQLLGVENGTASH